MRFFMPINRARIAARCRCHQDTKKFKKAMKKMLKPLDKEEERLYNIVYDFAVVA